MFTFGLIRWGTGHLYWLDIWCSGISKIVRAKVDCCNCKAVFTRYRHQLLLLLDEVDMPSHTQIRHMQLFFKFFFSQMAAGVNFGWSKITFDYKLKSLQTSLKISPYPLGCHILPLLARIQKGQKWNKINLEFAQTMLTCIYFVCLQKFISVSKGMYEKITKRAIMSIWSPLEQFFSKSFF